MYTEENKILLTYTLGGSHFVQRGEYTAAKIELGPEITYSCGIKGPQCIIKSPIQVVKPSVSSKSECNITLDWIFIKGCLERPKLPKGANYHRWNRSEIGKLAQDWVKLKPEARIRRHLEIYVSDMTGQVDPEFKYEIV